MLKESLFYSKILLFGEYGIIENAMGLSIPFDFYKGSLKTDGLNNEEAKASNHELNKYCTHLEDMQAKGELKGVLDVQTFRTDIENGMHFDSTIPRGFGVGSSGALCAAIYNKYAINKIDPEDNMVKDDLVVLKETFIQMESYFHGKSSGIDPLICYLKLPLLIKSKNDLGTVGIPESRAGQGAIFLLDSGQPGETEPMVNIFMEKCKQDGFRKMIRSQFVQYNDACIKSFLNREVKELFRNLKLLSKFLLENFTPMIPSVFHKLWKQGLDTNAYYLKLCGSGGGGFILGFTQDIDKAKKMLSSHEMEVIYTF